MTRMRSILLGAGSSLVLVLSACGAESQLVEVPGLPLKDLAAQASRFDAVTLAQDIAILEELRRQMAAYKTKSAKIDVAKFKEMTDVTRKYAIPLLEYLDRERVTRR